MVEIDLGRCSNDIGLVDPSEGHTVKLEWSRHQQQPARQLTQKHHPLAPKSSSEEDENRAGCDGWTQCCRAMRLSGFFGLLDIFGGVVASSFVGGHNTCRSVLLASDFNFLVFRIDIFGGLGTGLQALVETSTSLDLGPTKTTDVRCNVFTATMTSHL